MTKAALLVDTSLVYMANASKLGHLTRSDGYETGALYGLVRSINAMAKKLLLQHDELDVYLVFDAGGTSRKRALDGTYKAGRKQGPMMVTEERDHFTDIVNWAWFRGFAVAYANDQEADTVIACLANQLHEETDYVLIMSRDHDFHALLRDNVELAANASDRRVTIAGWQAPFSPQLYPMYLALSGDKTDNVQKVVSQERATSILTDLALFDELTGEEQQAFYANYELTRMDWSGDVTIIAPDTADEAGLMAWYEVMEFKSLLKDKS